jgi:hypothetical protein
MARQKKPTTEYAFQIKAYTPETMPLARLAEYLKDLAVLFGESDRVHLLRIRKGSTVPVLYVEREAEPKVRERLLSVGRLDADPVLERAWKDIDERLRADNATGFVLDPAGGKLLDFPGARRRGEPEYGPIDQPGALDGIPIKIGGYRSLVPVHLRAPGGEVLIAKATHDVAKKIARHLFDDFLRVSGLGMWKRTYEGVWKMEHFRIKTFEVLPPESFAEAVDALRAVPADWKKRDDPLRELLELRHGTSK